MIAVFWVIYETAKIKKTANVRIKQQRRFRDTMVGVVK